MATARKTNDEIAKSQEATTGIVTPDELDDGSLVEFITEPNTFDNETLANIDTFADAMRLATKAFGGVVNAHEDKNLGTGFRLTDDDDKYRLIGVPLLLLDWRFNDGDFGKEFVSIHAIQQNEDGTATKLVINDGGTGICRDLRNYTDKTGRKGGLFLRKGLRFSDYETDIDTGIPLTKAEVADYHKSGRKTGKGRTTYLDFSA